MIKYLIPTLFLFSSGAYAETTTARIQDHYNTVNESVPTTSEQCQDVQVPVYGQSGFNTGNAIIGGLVGGLLGNQVGGGSGREAATGVGAMAGAIVGGNSGNRQVTGYRTERQCEEVTTFSTRSRRVYSHSSVVFTDNGQTITLNYQR